MNAPRAAPGWRLLPLIAVAMPGAWLCAAEIAPPKAANGAAPKAVENSLTGAKRDFDALRAGKFSPDEKLRLDAPPTPVPGSVLQRELANPPTSPPGRPEATTLTADGERQKVNAESWLVDAMSKPASRGAAEKPGMPTADIKPSDEKAVRRTEDSPAEQKPATPKTTAENPLAKYLAGWMTPADYTLLKPTIHGGLQTPGMTPPAAELPGASLTPVANTRGDAAAQTFGPTVVGSAAFKPNPYLETVAPPALVAPASLPTSGVMAGVNESGKRGAGIARELRDPKNDERSRPSPAEMLKPRDDEKYFKQLKRF